MTFTSPGTFSWLCYAICPPGSIVNSRSRRMWPSRPTVACMELSGTIPNVATVRPLCSVGALSCASPRALMTPKAGTATIDSAANPKEVTLGFALGYREGTFKNLRHSRSVAVDARLAVAFVDILQDLDISDSDIDQEVIAQTIKGDDTLSEPPQRRKCHNKDFGEGVTNAAGQATLGSCIGTGSTRVPNGWARRKQAKDDCFLGDTRPAMSAVATSATDLIRTRASAYPISAYSPDSIG